MENDGEFENTLYASREYRNITNRQSNDDVASVQNTLKIFTVT